MASNIKSKPSSKELPTEPFKRAVTGCLRALARKPELEVAFAAERPGLMGGKVRLPEPPRKLGKGEAAIVRGHADSIALRLACHDQALHRRLQPAGQQARAVFEAVEQARVEAIGARRMDGVAQNLTAMLDERFHRGKFDQITERADAPIEDALALMVRERLTGLAPPPAAKRLVDLWRPLIEERAGQDLDRLENLVEDQRQFSDVVHDLLDALEMGEDRSRDSEDEEDEGEEDRRKQESGEDGDAADSDDMQRMSMEDTQVSAEDMPMLRPKPSTRLPRTWPMIRTWATPKHRANRRGRAISARTNRVGRTIAPSPPNLTRRLPLKTFAKQRSWIA